MPRPGAPALHRHPNDSPSPCRNRATTSRPNLAGPSPTPATGAGSCPDGGRVLARVHCSTGCARVVRPLHRFRHLRGRWRHQQGTRKLPRLTCRRSIGRADTCRPWGVQQSHEPCSPRAAETVHGTKLGPRAHGCLQAWLYVGAMISTPRSAPQHSCRTGARAFRAVAVGSAFLAVVAALGGCQPAGSGGVSASSSSPTRSVTAMGPVSIALPEGFSFKSGPNSDGMTRYAATRGSAGVSASPSTQGAGATGPVIVVVVDSRSRQSASREADSAARISRSGVGGNLQVEVQQSKRSGSADAWLLSMPRIPSRTSGGPERRSLELIADVGATMVVVRAEGPASSFDADGLASAIDSVTFR
jgi:hypothetical protein